MLLGVKPKDFDIVTSAKPEEIEALLERTIPIGKEFGVILAIQDGHHFEVATFRSDSSYSDGRRPDAVIFTSAKEDALRRDFTINGMFYDPITDQILDYVDGQKDLEMRLIRFIGNPAERIMEDHLRILRAIRLKNVLNFQYDPETYQALLKHASLLVDRISAERVRNELNKIIVSPYAVNAFQDMEDTGVLKILLPELQEMKGVAQPYQYHQEGDVWNHAMQSLAWLAAQVAEQETQRLDPQLPLALRCALLLHDVGKTKTFSVQERIRFDHHDAASRDIARKLLTRLHFDNKLIDEVCWLVEHHMTVVPLLQMPKGRQIHWFHQPYFKNLLKLFEADCRGTTPQHLDLFDRIKKLYHETIEMMPKLPDPLLHGEDLMEALKLKPGKQVGELLQHIREKQLAGELKTKEEAVEWAKLSNPTSSSPAS